MCDAPSENVPRFAQSFDFIFSGTSLLKSLNEARITGGDEEIVQLYCDED